LPTRPVRLFQAQRHPRSPDPDTLVTRPYARTEPLCPPPSREPPTVCERPRIGLATHAAQADRRSRLRDSLRRARWVAPVALLLLLAAAAAAALNAQQRPGSAPPQAPAASGRSATAGKASAPATQGAVFAPLAGGASAAPAAGSPASAAATSTALAEPASSTPTPRAAAEQLALGSYREALAAYRKLARARPEQPAFATVALLLERRLAERCRQRKEEGGVPCTAESP
jgi:hypothetical protein